MKTTVLLILVALSLAACERNASASGNPPPYVTVFTVLTEDGREVECVWAASNHGGGGLSCDWDGAR